MKSEERKLKTLEKNIKIDETALEKKENEMGQVKFWIACYGTFLR